VVPQQFRGELLRIAHEIPLAGHLGISKTKARLSQHFYWPKMGTDVSNYCRSCVTCQRVGKAGPAIKAPLIPLPVIEEPFQRIAVDIVGPLAVPSSSGKQYILTVVDYATRYPEAVALSSTRADKVADALLAIFSRVGFPREMLTDQGTQFMSRLMEALCKRMQVKHLVSSAYHPQTNGLCERFNGTLKQMLRMLVETQGRDWERYLPHLLFAYREVPQASTGFSPFELLYGRRVRGPLGLVQIMRQEIDEMLQLGVIRRSKSAWASPVVLVPKKDRTTRFCVDYRGLNAITASDAHPMPRIEELLEKLAGADYLTIMDLSRGYWQIPLSPEAQEKSAFITPFGLYESTVMPFGMKNAPATFQRMVNRLLQGLETYAVAYLDDIAIFSSSWKEHLQHLEEVLRRIHQAGLTIKPGKCQMGKREVHYLGHRVGEGTMEPEHGNGDGLAHQGEPAEVRMEENHQVLPP
ncbi:uncharacterized protein, partial [Ranitomeya imitator]|uniref:uncharacterized protein n=1 Tax=Ranitomeya imitator TaxID=111125 RepID=UPI0037E87150